MALAVQISLSKWLHTVLEEPYLAVYHSVLVEEDSDIYRPVQEYLGRFEHRLLGTGKQPDDSMMFGVGVWKLYEVKGKI
jgi:hypothetical protein